jgi:hypothetical protein
LRAADSVLDHAAKAIEIEDIEARVAILEQKLKAGFKVGFYAVKSAFPGETAGGTSEPCKRARPLVETGLISAISERNVGQISVGPDLDTDHKGCSRSLLWRFCRVGGSE